MWQKWLDSWDSDGGKIVMLFVCISVFSALWATFQSPIWERLIDLFCGALLMFLRNRKDPARVVADELHGTDARKMAKALSLIAADKDGGISTNVADQAKDALRAAGYDLTGERPQLKEGS